MGSRTAISAGVLAVALAAVPVGAPAASAAAQDCTRDGGLLSGVTNTLCDVVEAVTGTVDTLTGGVTDPVTDGVDKVSDEVLGRVGEAAPTARATPSTTSPVKPSTTSPTTPRPSRTGLVPETLGDVCLPVLACEDQGVAVRPTPRSTPSATATEVRTGRGWESTATAPAVPRATPRRAGRTRSARARRSRRRRRPPTRRSRGSICCGPTRSCTSSRCPCRTSGWCAPPRPPPTCWGRR
ncbi:hypothetical protein ACFQQB_70960 [Nonomuraea rubra]|uniref:hypothetical protein n=1 Tax=Nonomuraea rubra TaxID=46180 RepID=UPI0036244753